MAKVFAGHVQKHGRFAAFIIEAERPRKDNLRSMPNVPAAFRRTLKNLEKIAMNRVPFAAVFPAHLISQHIDNSNRKQQMPNITKFRLIELRDPRQLDLPRFVEAARQGESPWRALWEHREQIDNR